MYSIQCLNDGVLVFPLSDCTSQKSSTCIVQGVVTMVPILHHTGTLYTNLIVVVSGSIIYNWLGYMAIGAVLEQIV